MSPEALEISKHVGSILDLKVHGSFDFGKQDMPLNGDSVVSFSFSLISRW